YRPDRRSVEERVDELAERRLSGAFLTPGRRVHVAGSRLPDLHVALLDQARQHRAHRGATRRVRNPLVDLLRCRFTELVDSVHHLTRAPRETGFGRQRRVDLLLKNQHYAKKLAPMAAGVKLVALPGRAYFPI